MEVIILTDGLEEYSVQFHEEISVLSHADEALKEETFVEQAGDILEDYGEVDSFVPCFYKRQGIKINGYAYDYESDLLTLVISYYLDEPDLQKAHINSTDLKRIFKYGLNFLEKCLANGNGWIDTSNETIELAKLIYDSREALTGVKLVVVTDGITQKEAATADEFKGVDISKVVWDIERLYNFSKTGEREKISVVFSEYGYNPLPAVSVDVTSEGYKSYLSYVPGNLLADIYAKWGINILDLNVRVFLTARGGVNKGIRKTILEEPSMFCAYNNGITAYSESIEIEGNGEGYIIQSATDFQIINGGQTTASLYHARRKDRASLEGIMVPLKLIVISDEENRLRHLNRISQYSNTQNKVQLADLAANERPHPEIQAISNSIMAPDPTGGSQQSYWFYERARGSYEEKRNLEAKTPAQKRRYDVMRPKSQKFDKIKFGKVWNTYLRLPYIVSLGGQKNFARFNSWLREQSGEDWVKFFQNTVALLILWDITEKIVRKQKFAGYRHNIVAYTLALLFQKTDSGIDLDKIWSNQKTSDNLRKVIEGLCMTVNNHIRSTGFNVTEYCKKKECWDALISKYGITLSASLEDDLLSGDASQNYGADISSEKGAVDFCTAKGAQAWFDLAKWLKERQFLSPKARSQCFYMGKFLSRSREPSYVLSLACESVWKNAVIRGWDQQQE